MPDHERLLPGLFEIVNDSGALAVQVPANRHSPLHKALLEVSSSARWARFTGGAEKLITYDAPEYLYDILSRITSRLNLWETMYYHVMDSHAGLVEWYRGTGMRPFLEKLPDDSSRREFEGEVLAACIEGYPAQKDGKILFPFKRIFFVAYK